MDQRKIFPGAPRGLTMTRHSIYPLSLYLAQIARVLALSYIDWRGVAITLVI